MNDDELLELAKKDVKPSKEKSIVLNDVEVFIKVMNLKAGRHKHPVPKLYEAYLLFSTNLTPVPKDKFVEKFNEYYKKYTEEEFVYFKLAIPVWELLSKVKKHHEEDNKENKT